MKVSKFVCLATFLGIATTDWATCCIRPRSDSQDATTLPFMSLTIPVSTIQLTEKMPEKVDSFKALTLKGPLSERAQIDKIIKRICAHVNCDNIAYLILEECDWSVVDKIIPHFKQLKKLIILGLQEQKPLATEKAQIIDSVCTLLDTQTLTELIVWNAAFNDADAEKIVDKITPDNPLEILDFSDNCITDTGATRISELIKKNHNLQTVDLRNNNIHDLGGLDLYEATYNLTQIPEIVLFNNPIVGPTLRYIFHLDSEE